MYGIQAEERSDISPQSRLMASIVLIIVPTVEIGARGFRQPVHHSWRRLRHFRHRRFGSQSPVAYRATWHAPSRAGIRAGRISRELHGAATTLHLLTGTVDETSSATPVETSSVARIDKRMTMSTTREELP